MKLIKLITLGLLIFFAQTAYCQSQSSAVFAQAKKLDFLSDEEIVGHKVKFNAVIPYDLIYIKTDKGKYKNITKVDKNWFNSDVANQKEFFISGIETYEDGKRHSSYLIAELNDTKYYILFQETICKETNALFLYKRNERTVNYSIFQWANDVCHQH